MMLRIVDGDDQGISTHQWEAEIEVEVPFLKMDQIRIKPLDVADQLFTHIRDQVAAGSASWQLGAGDGHQQRNN